MRIQHNIAAMNSYRNYSNNVAAVNKNLEKLSSGYKINRAGDDAAGLAISEKMRAQITGLEAAQKNVKDGISLVKTAEGAMQEIQDMLNRMDYLATQSANGTYDNDVDRKNLNKEVTALKSEINRIADSANFNGIKLLDGSLASEETASSSNSKVDLSKLGVDLITNGMDLSATKGKYVTDALFANNSNSVNATVVNGDKVSVKINYTDAEGVAHDKEMTLKIGNKDSAAGTNAAQGVYLDDGSEDGIFLGNLAAGGTIDAEKFSGAVKTALEKDADFKAAFEIKVEDTSTGGTKGLSFEARTAGANGAKINSMSIAVTQKATTGVTPKPEYRQVGIMTNTVGEDSLKAIDFTKALIFDTQAAATSTVSTRDIDEAIFEINGEKFVFIQQNGEKDYDFQKALRDAGVTHWIEVAAKDTIAANTDIAGMVKKIATATGLKVEQGNVDTATTAGKVGWKPAATPAATDKYLVFRPGNSTTTKTGGKGGLTLQIGDTADTFNQLRVNVGDMHVNAMGTGKTTLDGKEIDVTKTIEDIDISSLEGAQEAIGVIKNAINYVSGVRGDLGAVQNRLEHTANNLSVMRENIQDAESTIRDTDIAEEMMSYTKNNILVQSAQAMLAQANQIPQGVLQLLG